jgi:hypothetical protein
MSLLDQVSISDKQGSSNGVPIDLGDLPTGRYEARWNDGMLQRASADGPGEALLALMSLVAYEETGAAYIYRLTPNSAPELRAVLIIVSDTSEPE